MSEITVKALFDYENSLAARWLDAATYPWELLPQIPSIIRTLIDEGLPGYTEVKPDVWVGEGVTITDTATLNGPAIIGPGTEIRPGAYIRGNLLCGEGCVLGNSSEFKNALLLDHVQNPHYNYVGDSILGNYAHTGAGTICSNLKSDGKNIVIHDRLAEPAKDYETGLRKIGAILGDHADIGCQSVLNPGTVVGKGSRVYPLTSVRGVIPAGVIVKGQADIVEIER